MTLNLPALLKLANFPKEKIDRLVKDINYISDEDKYKLADLAWYIISQKYFMLLSLHRSQLLNEISQGKRKYNANDFEEIKAKLIHDFIQKIEYSESQETITDVKKQLEQLKTKPLHQDKVTSPPPIQKP